MNGNLLRIRRRKALTRKDLATLSGVDESTIYRLEMGRVANPAPRTLHRIADALKVDVEQLTAEQSDFGI